jgi:gamma-tubulin complex component 3
MIHNFSTSHGDPFVGAFAERMLVHVTRPFYDMLRQWIYDGELSDPYHEFFVTEQNAQDAGEKDTDPRRAPATSVWEDKYKLDESMVPTIITEDFARKVFLIGKSLNFIRYGCGDSAWVEAYCKEASRELRYGDTATLESSIDKAYKATMARLTHLMDSKFHLFEHLRALKKYLLLGQGDFIALLMESLSSSLDNPAGSQYRHTLTAQLEHAIRGSNAQYDSQDVLRRLDARLVELSHGDVGWDVFTLEYKVDAPVDVVITPWASKQYLVIFNLLWRVKRVEFALGSTWRRCMTGARGVLATVDDGKLSRDWKVARCCIAEMIHFVNQLQYYILFEVIEASWDQLQTAITKPNCTLDDLINAHIRYLRSITHKGLLGKPASGNREESFTVQLHEILKIMLAYKDVVDGLYSFSVAEFTRRQELAAKIETRTARGQWGLTDADADDRNSPTPPPSRHNLPSRGTNSPFAPNPSAGIPGLPNPSAGGEDQMLPALRTRLGDLAREFKARVNVMLGDLAVQSDVDMKFLGVVMNFNDVYAPRKRRREGHKGRTPGVGIGAGTGTVRREEK